MPGAEQLNASIQNHFFIINRVLPVYREIKMSKLSLIEMVSTII